MKKEIITVAHDGFAGIVVLQCSEAVASAIRTHGIHDIAETEEINNRGIFEITLTNEPESCDCCSGHVHGNYDVFELDSVKRIGNLQEWRDELPIGNHKGLISVPVECLEEHLKLLEESSWSALYKLAIGDQLKAMIEAAGKSLPEETDTSNVSDSTVLIPMCRPMVLKPHRRLHGSEFPESFGGVWEIRERWDMDKKGGGYCKVIRSMSGNPEKEPVGESFSIIYEMACSAFVELSVTPKERAA